MMKSKKTNSKNMPLPDNDILDTATRIIDALMDEDIDPGLRTKMQQWFRSDMSDLEKQEAFMRYADKLKPYTGKLKGDALLRYNKLASSLGLQEVPVKGRVMALKPKRSGVRLWYVAAVLIPVFVIGGAYLLLNTGKTDRVELMVGMADHVQEVSLPDNSYVAVSPNSTMLYYEPENNERKVELSGEAFFKVSKDAERPFTVSTGNIEVKVLGTDFTVSDFPGGSDSVVSLFDGSVDVQADGIANTLSRGERLTYNPSTDEIVISIIPYGEMIAKGYKPRLKFDRATFGEVFEAMSAYYEVEIEAAANVDTSGGSLTIDLDGESLEASLNLLVKMGRDRFGYSIEDDNKVIISRK